MSRQTGGRGSGGSGPSGGNGGNVARGAGFAAAKGAGLIGVAVLIGIVLLQVVDDGERGPVGASDADTTEATADGGPDATAGGDAETTAPTTAAEPPLALEELRVLVLNGGAPAGSARETSNALQQAGYTNQPEAADWAGRDQEGNAVLCRAGLEREASSLAIAVGEGTPVEEFPEPPPPGADDDVDCVVVVGASA